tara:strand:+ start:12837 stop:13745 length:909 start_codon:yes stop_codon:yes gene_type:complete
MNLKIIGYHYIRTKSYSKFKSLNFLDKKDFIEQIKFISKNYKIISLNELLNHKKLKKENALLTFDDGYIDHYEIVFPILKKYKIPAIFFAPEKTLKQKDFLDVNKLQLILSKFNDRKKLFKLIESDLRKIINVDYYLKLQKKLSKDYDHRWHDNYTNIIRNFLQYLLPIKIRKKIINSYFLKTIDNDPKKLIKNFYLSFNNAKEMLSDDICFGSHGSDHEWLEFLNYKEQYNDILKSKNNLLNLGVKEKQLTMCYPYGSYNKDTIKILRKLNFKYGFANKYGVVKNLDKNRFELPRVDTNEF